MAASQPPTLGWEGSASTTHATSSDSLPREVVECLRNARFLHLATCTDNIPHVSLMNYTYLPSHPFPSSSTAQLPPQGPVIIMTSNLSSKKALNMIKNPHVSLLVHDWVSSRPPTNTANSNARERSPAGNARSSSLANMLMQMNSAAVSSISSTINGEAKVLDFGSPEEKWCKEQHLANNTFEHDNNTATQNVFGTSPEQSRVGDGGRESYIEDQNVRVIVVSIRDGRISDWKGGVKDWIITSEAGGNTTGATPVDIPTVNGVTRD
ncbi:Hypothetical protein R9X50_00177000 [Acrodontium crateriforme]|uniref:Pyridoxamine 5'-phosphate oxidase N-terminal domain-containing protein n=1 Tax=Acrodontium crateriforme TaxID=150365 RepID=A0AAQ3LZP2_9PEZI|nr:Hypothetical protein R9X50_00177000 [Acrodontium crateriforme]